MWEDFGEVWAKVVETGVRPSLEYTPASDPFPNHPLLPTPTVTSFRSPFRLEDKLNFLWTFTKELVSFPPSLSLRSFVVTNLVSIFTPLLSPSYLFGRTGFSSFPLCPVLSRSLVSI